MAIQVNVICARNLPQKWFESADAYVQIRYGDETKSTKTDNQGGSDPAFNQVLTFNSKGALGTLEAAVYDDDVGFDDFLCKAKLDLSQIARFESVRGFFPLENAHGAHSGDIKLEITFL